jgi:DNA-binding PucR family transcriptional regulator
MNFVDFDKASAAAKTAIEQLRAAELDISDELAAKLHATIHAGLADASTNLTTVLDPVLKALAPAVSVLADLNTTLQLFVRESSLWRETAQRLNLSGK